MLQTHYKSKEYRMSFCPWSFLIFATLWVNSADDEWIMRYLSYLFHKIGYISGKLSLGDNSKGDNLREISKRIFWVKYNKDLKMSSDAFLPNIISYSCLVWEMMIYLSNRYQFNAIMSALVATSAKLKSVWNRRFWTHKLPITTAADDILIYIFIFFQRK